MKLAFYRVSNSQDFGRDTFDNLLERQRPQEILDKLCSLSDDEFRIYDMTNKYDVIGFEDDYNDEILDGGWWCIVIND